jgi:hypothetical protein
MSDIAKERCRENGMDPDFVGTKGYPNWHEFTDEAKAATQKFLDEIAKIIKERDD